MSCTQGQTLQHPETVLPPGDPFEPRPTNRQKPPMKLHSPEFYDSLSKIWLTRRALRELKRRTKQPHRRHRQTPTSRSDIQPGIANQVQRFARHGGPELRDLRGYQEPGAVSSSKARGGTETEPAGLTMEETPKTKQISAYDKNFESLLIRHGIYPEGYNARGRRDSPQPPLEGLHQSLAKRRASLSPSRWPMSRFNDFLAKNKEVILEGDVVRNVVPIISGDTDIPNQQNILFNQLESITNGATVDAQLDFYDGAWREDLDDSVQDALGRVLLPTKHRTAPIAPNFFLEVKGPNGSADVGKRQACYLGALGARAMLMLQSYKQQPTYDGNAYTISTTYHNGMLRMYATYPIRGKDRIEYHTTKVNSWALDGNINHFLEGVAAFRNARDWARRLRDDLITSANDKEASLAAQPSPFHTSNNGSVTADAENAT